jgi:hypothetical protein
MTLHHAQAAMLSVISARTVMATAAHTRLLCAASWESLAQST